MEFFCSLQEVTIITRAMELDESSALKQAPKSRWDDTTITENQGKARMISDHVCVFRFGFVVSDLKFLLIKLMLENKCNSNQPFNW